MEIKHGSVVISKAGRDKGKYFAVVSVDEKFAYIIDGKERPLDKPKKKNLIHLIPTHYTVLEEKMTANQALKKALNKTKLENGGK